MKMTSLKALLLAGSALVAASSASAQVATVDTVVNDLIGQGYTAVEVTNGVNSFKVEAMKDGIQYEAVFDATTGEMVVDGASFEDDLANGSSDSAGSGGNSGGSGDSGGDSGGSGDSGGGDSGGSGGGSGGGGESAVLMAPELDYLTGGQGGDIEFV
jgi:hypothetical protein